MGAPDERTPEVEIGPFWVHDDSRSRVVSRIVDLCAPGRARPAFAFALHVGGLNHRRDPDFVLAMRLADVVYADGASIVWLARRAGATTVERAPTTDIGWDVLRGFASNYGRAPRVALLGGPVGLAARAGRALEEAGVAHVVFTEHGYHTDWRPVLGALREAAPDLTIVGMGAPQEMVWSHGNRDELPPTVVLTCGGWFGFLAGDERRAPAPMRRSGLEWLARMGQSPRRLGPRYARGAVATVILTIGVWQRRPAQGSDDE